MNEKELEDLENIAIKFEREKNNELMTMEIKFPKKHLLNVINFFRNLNS